MQRSEVPFFEYRIDFFGFSTSLDQAVAVELKLRKWRRAFQQALLYQLCAEYVYIAVPSMTAMRVDEVLLVEHSIGLIEVQDSGRCVQRVEAKKSSMVRPHYREWCISYGGG